MLESFRFELTGLVYIIILPIYPKAIRGQSGTLLEEGVMHVTMDSYLDSGVQGYIRNVARREEYRLGGYTFEDIVQEGYLCYCKVWNKYVKNGEKYGVLFDTPNPSPEQRKFFMELLKTTMHNHIADLAWKNQYDVEVPISSLTRADQTEEAAWEALMPSEPEQATVGTLIATAPAEVKQLLTMLVNDAVNWGKYRKVKRRRSRETTNRYLCRHMGLEPGTDVVGKLTRHFLGSGVDLMDQLVGELFSQVAAKPSQADGAAPLA